MTAITAGIRLSLVSPPKGIKSIIYIPGNTLPFFSATYRKIAVDYLDGVIDKNLNIIFNPFNRSRLSHPNNIFNCKNRPNFIQ